MHCVVRATELFEGQPVAVSDRGGVGVELERLLEAVCGGSSISALQLHPAQRVEGLGAAVELCGPVRQIECEVELLARLGANLLRRDGR